LVKILKSILTFDEINAVRLNNLKFLKKIETIPRPSIKGFEHWNCGAFTKILIATGYPDNVCKQLEQGFNFFGNIDGDKIFLKKTDARTRASKKKELNLITEYHQI